MHEHGHVVIPTNNEHACLLKKHPRAEAYEKHADFPTHTFVLCVWCMHSLAPLWGPSAHNGFLVAQSLISTVALINFQEKEKRGKVRSVKVWLETKPQPADYFILGTGPQRPPYMFIWWSSSPPAACPCQLSLSSASLPPSFLALCSLSSPFSLFFLSLCDV